MSGFVTFWVTLNAVAVVVGTIVGGTVWFLALILAAIATLMLCMKLFLFIIPATLGVVACGAGFFITALVLMLLNAFIWYYRLAFGLSGKE
jgi:hypothetical protein